MGMGSSEPSESALSGNGQFVRAERGRLSDHSIETLTKLRSWNRFLGVKNVGDDDIDFEEADDCKEQEIPDEDGSKQTLLI